MQRKRVKLFAIAFLLGSALSASADDAIKITFGNGADSQIFSLDSLREMTFAGDNLVLYATSGTSTRLSLDEIAEITFEADISTAVTPATVALTPDVTISYRAGCVEVSNPMGEPLRVGVYTVQGILLNQVTSASSGVTLSFEALPQGIYIVKANKAVLKVKK